MRKPGGIAIATESHGVQSEQDALILDMLKVAEGNPTR